MRPTVAHADGPPSRSRLALLQARRTAHLQQDFLRRKKLSNAYNHLAFTMFNNKGQARKVDALLSGDGEANDAATQWQCVTCRQAIWVRMRRAVCPLCRRFHHTTCMTGTILLIKPVAPVNGDAKASRPAMHITVCLECQATVASLRKFASFREAFDLPRKVDIFYGVFAKLKASIEDCINSFGLFVKSFVEQSFMARKADYVECQTCHRNLVSLFDSLTKALKRLVAASFETARETKVAKGMNVSVSEWTQERLAHLRALEMHWKQVKVQPVAADETVERERQLSGAQSARRRGGSSPPPAQPPAHQKSLADLEVAPGDIVVDSVSPLVCPPHGGTRITIMGRNLRSVGVRIGGMRCVVLPPTRYNGAGGDGDAVVVVAPAIMREGQMDVEVFDISEPPTPPTSSTSLPALSPRGAPPSSARAPVVLENLVMYSAHVPDDALLLLSGDEGGLGDGDSSSDTDSFLDAEVSILSLCPVVSPRDGTTLELTGTGIRLGASVLVDDVDCARVTVRDAAADGTTQRVTFTSPRLLEDGIKSVVVVNPNGSSARLDNVLLYGDF